jgi:histidyl-tRNA synthetase
MAKSAQITAVKGFRDILPDESARWQVLEAVALDIFSRYAFGEIRLPIAERTELFARSIGETTDIVEKEMYTFVDRGDTSMTLRPEATAGAVRAAIEHGFVARDREVRVFYRGPMFRRERPQKGRFRQFYQIGAEVLGREDPVADAEILVLLRDLLVQVGARDVQFEVNSLGDETCRPSYRDRLREFAVSRRAQLCDNCQRRLERNPLRLLDCKEEACRRAMVGAPLLIDSLCGPCAEHFADVRRLLDVARVPVTLNPRIVRGLDYYCRTAFEIVAAGLGSQNAVGGGGRYDGLVATLGGPAIGGVGFALGVERLATVASGLATGASPRPIVVAPLGSEAWAAGLSVASALREAGRRVELVAGRPSLKSALRHADRIGAQHLLMIGPEELTAGRGSVRDLEGRVDRPLSVDLKTAGERLLAQVDGRAEAIA